MAAQATEPELVPDLLKALQKFPEAPAVLVREPWRRWLGTDQGCWGQGDDGSSVMMDHSAASPWCSKDHGAYIFGSSAQKAKIATECLGFILDLEVKRRGTASTIEAPLKRRKTGPSVVLLDIEGTTTPISFVKDRLFPYAASAVASWVETAGEKELEEVARDYEKQCQEDKVPFNAASPKEEGKLWKSGYELGELKGEMFEDSKHGGQHCKCVEESSERAPPAAMAEWVAAGRRVAIFSSGSREAQQLIFKYTSYGDLTPFLSAYFDPKSAQASKQEAKAYTEIALSLGIAPAEGGFAAVVAAVVATGGFRGGWWHSVSIREDWIVLLRNEHLREDYRQRVRYHARRLQVKDHQQVLERYERRRHTMDRSQLLKCTFHVASWIAKLPPVQMTQRYGDVSGASLLVHYIEALLQQQFQVCHQLTNVLTKVFLRTNNLADEEWTKLRGLLVQLLPQLLPQGSEVAEVTAVQLDSAVDSTTVTGRLLAKAIQVWRNATDESRELYETWDIPKMQKVFRKAVAALSPPRLKGSKGKDDADENEDGNSSTVDLQRRLRKLVLKCLEYLDLSDPTLKPSLELLEALIQQFQELGRELVASGRHWQQLELKCALASEASEALVKPRSRKRCQHGVRQESCRRCRPCPHGNVKWSCSSCSSCPHGKMKNHCVLCSGCPHGKLKHNCSQCAGCPHGKLKKNCFLCSGCPHGKTKKHCAVCTGCAHGKLKHNCSLCSGCPHGKLKQNCTSCSGCPHGKVAYRCPECNPCPHGQNKRSCLFCTDVLGEAQAASKAGWKTVLLKRPGNAPLPDTHGFREATSLLDV
eukprot:Skav229104  [mRNA]  locus=scaffold92:531979:544646:- [translate_table: standard]